MNPLSLGSCSPVIPDVLSGEEVASPTLVPEVPWLGLRLLPTWERVSVLPVLLPDWELALPVLLPGWGLALPAWE